MKNLLTLALVAFSVALISCEETITETVVEEVCTGNACLEVLIEGNVATDATWSSDSVYVLGGRIAVTSGATLTIEAGTIIKGQAGTGTNATALIVARGAKLMAVGTAAAPIIFTSVADEIQPGEVESPNLDEGINGLWGGIIVLGNARISADNESEQIEGIPANDSNGLYGGTDDADNSGTIQYISVRHGGANIGEGNEINGLTLGGVGSGTTIDHVEIVANQDDGIEWFGGTVNVSYALVWNAGDDAIDTDQAWAGTLDNFIVVNPGDECFELDGPEGSYVGAGHTIKNGTVAAMGASGLIDFDDNSDVKISNIYFFEVYSGQDTEGYNGFSANTGGFSASLFQSVLPAIVDGDGVITGTETIDKAFLTFAGVSVVAKGSNTVGATISEFTFSLASKSGALSGLGL
ncbi:MAG: hypothetical protein ACJA2C_000870 [Marinoscillum sp.]|jgi:hypothetical protein